MSAIVYGKRSFFEEIPSPVTKRARCSSSRSASESFVHQSSPSSLLLDHLIGLFPDMDLKDRVMAEFLYHIGAAVEVIGTETLYLGSYAQARIVARGPSGHYAIVYRTRLHTDLSAPEMQVVPICRLRPQPPLQQIRRYKHQPIG